MALTVPFYLSPNTQAADTVSSPISKQYGSSLDMDSRDVERSDYLTENSSARFPEVVMNGKTMESVF